MKISNMKKEESKITFTLEDASPAFANALRRIMISEVPTLAIEDIDFFDNSSALYDEIIAHRLALIPIKTDLKSFKLPDECSCKGKGCPKCQVAFTLVKKGPCVVYSGDLKPSDPKTVVTDANIPIVKLLEDQKIKLEAIAVLGQGKEHAKWQPGVVSYKYYPEVKVLKNTDKKLVEACPRNVFEESSGKVVVKNPEDCSLCKECIDVCGDNAVEVSGNNKKFIFVVESNGSLEPEKIITESASILAKTAKEFGKTLK